MLASAIFTKVSRQLGDAGATRWTAAALLDYINQGRREVVKRRPTDFLAKSVVQLVAGVEQSVAATSAHFFRVTRNMGADGATPGAVVRGPVDRAMLDAVAPDWMTTAGSTVKEFMATPGGIKYLVNPPVPATPDVYVEIETAAFLADLTQTDGSEDIGMPDRYAMALEAWMLARAFGEEREEGLQAKAAMYLQLFAAEMGVGEK